MRISEIQYRAEVKEWEKLQARLERQKKALEKAETKAEKYGVKEWTTEDRNEWLKTVELDGFYIKNKADQDKNGAWFDLGLKKSALKETEESIERCEARLEKKMETFEQEQEKAEELEKIAGKENTLKYTFEEMQKDWLNDNINLEGASGINYFWGKTPKGETFHIHRNSFGYTDRSLHCYTLRIAGKTIFTSGLFWRCYSVIKNS